ncbi:MAG: hypothetical protein R2856_10880 [Caldilineaceae bacterium]
MKITLLFVLFVVGLLLIAGCGAPPTQPAAPAEESQPAEEAAPAAAEPEPTPTPIIAELGTGDTQLIFWHLLTGPDGVTMQAMVEQFVAENPDISVRIESMPPASTTSCSRRWSPAIRPTSSLCMSSTPPASCARACCGPRSTSS